MDISVETKITALSDSPLNRSILQRSTKSILNPLHSVLDFQTDEPSHKRLSKPLPKTGLSKSTNKNRIDSNPCQSSRNRNQTRLHKLSTTRITVEMQISKMSITTGYLTTGWRVNH